MTDEIEVESIILGDGTTLLTSFCVEGKTGVAFKFDGGDGEVGKYYSQVANLGELDPDFILAFTKPESIDVMISRLEEAKEFFFSEPEYVWQVKE